MDLQDSSYKAVFNKSLKAVCLLLFFFAISFFYYKEIFDNWFILDDIVAIFHSTASLKEIIFENKLSNLFYTPLVVLSMKPDFLMFKLNPLPYHVQNFIILILVAFMFYKILRLYANTINSLVSAAFILFSLPSLVMVSWIVLRLYLYPTLFSLIIIYVFIKYRPNIRDNKLITVGLLVLTELCFLGKEQFMTLPFVLLILASGNLKKRVTDTFLFFILLVFHFLFRLYILKGFGGYIGMTFDLKTYIITILKSLFFASRIVYGYELLFLIIIAPLLISSLRKFFKVFLVWVLALGIQFLTMTGYPDILSLRYWLVPSLLICLIFSLGAEVIKNNILKASYILLISGFFLLNTLNKNAEIKSYLKKESLFYELASKAMVNEKYSNGIILIFEDKLLEKSAYLKIIDAIYSEKLGIKTYPIFIPADFILFYPQFITTNHKGIYEMRQNVISDIMTTVKEKLEKYKINFLSFTSALELSTKLIEGQVVKIKCNTPSNGIIFYVITKRIDKNKNERLFYDRIKLPYAEEINLKSLTKLKHAEIVKKERIFFDGKKLWQVNNKELEPFPSEALTAFSCVTVDNKITFPSDFIWLKE